MPGVLSQRHEHDLFHRRRNGRDLLTQGWWRNKGLFDGYFRQRPVERTIAAEPFIDDDAQRVLIAGRAGTRLHLLRCHVGDGSSRVQTLLRT